MKNIELTPSDKTFAAWANTENEYLNLTAEEAGMLLGYVLGHGYGVCLDATDTIVVIDTDEPENGIVAKGFDELLERICNWNYELIQDDEIVDAYREQILRDSEILDGIMERTGCHEGMPIGNPTVKEVISILSRLPEDYRITCCGSDCFIHLFARNKYLSIDCEQHWA